MTIAVLLLLGIIGFAVLSLPIAIKWAIDSALTNQKRKIRDEIQEELETLQIKWLLPASEGKPSHLAEIFDAAGRTVGTAAAQSIMRSFNAEKSHLSRVANEVGGEIVAEQNPMMGLLAGGKRGKGAAFTKLANMIAPMLANINPNHGNNGNGSSSVRDRLNR